MKKNDREAARIAGYISEFLHGYAPQFLTSSEHTLKSYRDALTLYVLFLEEKGITHDSLGRRSFEKGFIEEWIAWLKNARRCSPETCNIRLGSLRVFLEFVGSKDVGFMYLYQEAKLIKRQKCQKKKAEGLTRKAVAAILAAPDPSTRTGKRDLVFLMLLYATAARLDEILSIKLSHLYIDAAKPYVNLYGKGGKIRTAYLLPRAVEHIRAYLKAFHEPVPDPEAYLFYSRVGGKYVKLTEPALDKRIKIYAADAHKKCPEVPLDTHAHQFRHAKATHWLEDGMNIIQISFLLGHASLDTTMRYLDITTDDKRKALATLEGEEEKNVTKKWKDNNGSLADFCGLKR